ncbi:MAG: hypothetical protein EOO71_23835 [Myxococcaceae bacterium]|nr:MAG: hypothetical protein EOO71_23835 [Myxococcaceae bacterium]
MPSRLPRVGSGSGPIRTPRSDNRHDPIDSGSRRSNRIGGPPVAPEHFKPTASNKYRLSDQDPQSVLVREKKGEQRASTPPPPAFTEPTSKRYQADGDTFQEYRAKPGSTTRDCLNTAEEVMHQKPLTPFADDYSREKVTGKVFGGTPQQNIGIAKKARTQEPGAVDKKAAPDKGEGFVIVREKTVKEGARHHAEGVWGTDGKDRMTMHVWSDGTPDAEERKHTPEFKKYSTDPKSQDTFHDSWKDAFGKDKVTTTVLQKKE